MPGVWTRADVHQNLDPVPPQQDGELLRRMVECPIVKTDPRLSADHLSPMANHPPSWRAFGYTASTAPILPQRVPGNLRTFRIIARPRSPQTFFRDSLHHREEASWPVLLCRS